MSDALVEHLSSLRAFARSLTWDRHQADDLVHDAVLRALAAARQFTPGTNFKAWVSPSCATCFAIRRGGPGHGICRWMTRVRIEPSSRADQEDRLAFCDFRRAFHLLAPEHRSTASGRRLGNELRGGGKALQLSCRDGEEPGLARAA